MERSLQTAGTILPLKVQTGKLRRVVAEAGLQPTSLTVVSVDWWWESDGEGLGAGWGGVVIVEGEGEVLEEGRGCGGDDDGCYCGGDGREGAG